MYQFTVVAPDRVFGLGDCHWKKYGYWWSYIG
jgi:hypothetical protein